MIGAQRIEGRIGTGSGPPRRQQIVERQVLAEREAARQAEAEAGDVDDLQPGRARPSPTARRA